MRKITVKLKHGKVLDVYIWGTEAKFKRETVRYLKRKKGVGVGYCVCFHPSRGNLYGQIHFMKKWVGAGYCAHEFQHFFIDWARYMLKKGVTSRNEENFVLFTEEVIKSFWIQYLGKQK